MKRLLLVFSVVAVLSLIVATGNYEFNGSIRSNVMVTDGGGNPPPPPKGNPLPWPPASLMIADGGGNPPPPPKGSPLPWPPMSLRIVRISA